MWKMRAGRTRVDGVPTKGRGGAGAQSACWGRIYGLEGSPNASSGGRQPAKARTLRVGRRAGAAGARGGRAARGRARHRGASEER